MIFLETTLKTINIILIDELGKEKLNRYNVQRFCQRAGISRATFYRTFDGMDGLYRFFCEAQTEQNLLTNKNDVRAKFYKLISYIEDNKLVYINIYQQTGPLFFDHVLSPVFFKFLKQYYQNDRISNEGYQMLAQSLTHIIVEWINGDCQKSKKLVAQTIAKHLTEAERIAFII